MKVLSELDQLNRRTSELSNILDWQRTAIMDKKSEINRHNAKWFKRGEADARVANYELKNLIEVEAALDEYRSVLYARIKKIEPNPKSGSIEPNPKSGS